MHSRLLTSAPRVCRAPSAWSSARRDLTQIDLPSSDPVGTAKQIESILGVDASQAVQVSAKTGLNVEKILPQLISSVPPCVAPRKRRVTPGAVDTTRLGPRT